MNICNSLTAIPPIWANPFEPTIDIDASKSSGLAAVVTSRLPIAPLLNLNVATKPDSQDICFVPNGDYASVIKKFRPESFKSGKILDLKGNQLGKHEGIINYTIGQRKGIGIAHEEPLYVIEIDADKNEIVVGPKKFLIQKDMLNLLVLKIFLLCRTELT